MKVKVFDCEHEKDLESEINIFLDSGTYDIIDIKYSVATVTQQWWFTHVKEVVDFEKMFIYRRNIYCNFSNSAC